MLLVPVAIVPLIAAVDGRSVRAGASLGLLFGYVHTLTTVMWIAYTVHRYGEVSWPLAVLALALVAVPFAAAFAFVGGLAAFLSPRLPGGALFAWPVAWVLQEGLRTYVFTGCPWAMAAHPLADHPALIQTASLGGVYLTSFLIVLLNAAVYRGLRQPTARARLGTLGSALAGALLVAAWGAWRVDAVGSLPAPSTLRVALVQTGVEQEARWAAGQPERIYEALIQQTRELCLREKPELVVWSESASPLAWSWSPRLRLDVVALCRELHTAILLNTPWSDRPEEPDAPYYNAALLVTADGPVLPPYFKLRLVPFGEYVPLPWLLRRIGPISRAVPGGFTPGQDVVLLPFQGHRLAGAVCYEIVYPWLPREAVRRGADVLFTLTNDAWYGPFGAKRQHFQAAVFRAVENGRPLLRAAVTGITGWVDPAGRARTVPPKGSREIVVDMPVGVLETPFAVTAGDAVPWICAAAAALGILRRLREPRRFGRAAAPDNETGRGSTAI